MTSYLPKPLTSGPKADGRFGKQDFVYLPEQDVYRCACGALLPRHLTTGITLHRYWDRASCQTCTLSHYVPKDDIASISGTPTVKIDPARPLF